MSFFSVDDATSQTTTNLTQVDKRVGAGDAAEVTVTGDSTLTIGGKKSAVGVVNVERADVTALTRGLEEVFDFAARTTEAQQATLAAAFSGARANVEESEKILAAGLSPAGSGAGGGEFVTFALVAAAAAGAFFLARG